MTRRILRSMAEVLLPRNETLHVECEDEIVNYIDNYVLYLPPLFKFAFPLGVWAFQIAAIFLCGMPFTWLSRERKDKYLEGWARSMLWWRRDLLKGIKGLMMMGFFEHPEVMRLINYDQAGHVAQVKSRRLASYANEI